MKAGEQFIYTPGYPNGWAVTIIDPNPDEDGMIKVQRESDRCITWVYPTNLKGKSDGIRS